MQAFHDEAWRVVATLDSLGLPKDASALRDLLLQAQEIADGD